MKELEEKGYKPFAEETNIPQKGTWYRVAVGRFSSRGEAVAFTQGLERKGINYSFVRKLKEVNGKSVGLKVSWDPNTETDISHYNFYQVYQGDYKRINKGPIRHPTTTYTFVPKVTDEFDGPLCFVVTAVDTSGNESDYSDTVCVDKKTSNN